MPKHKRSLGGYHPQDVQRYLELLRLELTIIKDQLANEQAKFEERLAARLKNNEQIRAELHDALALERRTIEGTESEAPDPS